MDELYNKNFSVFDAYKFLTENGLESESNEIKNSSEKYGSYSTTLKRAKVINLLIKKNLLNEFLNSVWNSGLTEKGKIRIRFFENLYNKFYNDQEGLSNEEEDDESKIEMSEFAYEEDLKNYLLKNLFKIEDGLKIYESPDGIKGNEYFIPGTSRRIDILALDKQNNFVVIELKVSRGHEKVTGQVLFYKNMIKSLFKKEKVRIIIIAKEITTEIKISLKSEPDVEFFEYQLSCELKKINLNDYFLDKEK